MPECEVCNGQDFYEEDGQYYCVVCNTQAQSMVVEELDDTHMTTQPSSGALREVGKAQKKKDKRSEYDAGRPWTKYEAYQLILQGQAEALIEHKADPSVREVMLRLWARYLSLLGVAFVNEEKICLVPQDLANTGRWQRELHRGGMENPEVVPRKMKHKLRKKYSSSVFGPKKAKSGYNKGEESFSEALEGETFYEGDNPVEEEEDEVDNSDQSSFISDDWGDETDGDRNKNFGKWRLLHSVQQMNLPKTLAFTYLGCVFASNWITVSDILRWVNDGTIPYLETTHLLMPDMKLSAYDQHLFTPVHLSSAMLRHEAGRLLQFMGFEKIPETPVKYICISTTLSLDLPETLVPRVVRLLRECPVDVSYKVVTQVRAPQTLANVDALCAAYVLVALKQVFGLDDHRERLLSKYSKALQKKIGKDIRLFDWCAWQTHATCKFLQKRQNKSAAGSVDELCRTFERAGYRDQSFSHSKLYTRQKATKVTVFKQENRELLKRAANMLEECWRNRDATAARIRAEELASADSLDSVQAEPSQGSNPEHFRSSTLEHILNVEEFLYSELGIEDPGSLSATENSKDPSSSEPAYKGHSFKVSASAASPKSALPKSRSSRSPSPSSSHSLTSSSTPVSRVTLSPADDDMPLEKGFDDTENHEGVISHLLEMLSEAGDGYVLYLLSPDHCYPEEDSVKELRARQHSSYKWLLQVLSQWTFCPETDIEKMVWTIEGIMKEKSLLV